MRWVCGDGDFFFFFNQSFSDCGSGWLWLGWVSGCDVGVAGLWFGFGQKFQFVGSWVAMAVIGLAVAGGGYWFSGFVGLFIIVLPSKRERERERERIKK